MLLTSWNKYGSRRGSVGLNWYWRNCLQLPRGIGEQIKTFYSWLEGESAAQTQKINLEAVAAELAHFIITLHTIDASQGPLAGPDNFYRGGSLAVYDQEVRNALAILICI